MITWEQHRVILSRGGLHIRITVLTVLFILLSYYNGGKGGAYFVRIYYI